MQVQATDANMKNEIEAKLQHNQQNWRSMGLLLSRPIMRAGTLSDCCPERTLERKDRALAPLRCKEPPAQTAGVSSALVAALPLVDEWERLLA